MIKDIRLFALAHEGDSSALELAEAAAARTGASVACTGFVVLPDGYLGYSESLESEAVGQARREQRPYFLRLEDELTERPRPIGFELIESYPKQLEAAAAARARRADAVVARAPPQSHETYHSALIEAALFGGSAPVLVSPLHWHARELGKRILVCWDGSPEAARAAHEALNFAAPDAHILVARVAAHPERKDDKEDRLMAEHLARGGVAAEARLYTASDGGAAAALDHAAQEFDADLVVLGAYARPRLQEALFGGVTRALLRAPGRPLLLAR